MKVIMYEMNSLPVSIFANILVFIVDDENGGRDTTAQMVQIVQSLHHTPNIKSRSIIMIYTI